MCTRFVYNGIDKIVGFNFGGGFVLLVWKNGKKCGFCDKKSDNLIGF